MPHRGTKVVGVARAIEQKIAILAVFAIKIVPEHFSQTFEQQRTNCLVFCAIRRQNRDALQGQTNGKGGIYEQYWFGKQEASTPQHAERQALLTLEPRGNQE
jgi:hypothetical protein